MKSTNLFRFALLCCGFLFGFAYAAEQASPQPAPFTFRSKVETKVCPEGTVPIMVPSGVDPAYEGHFFKKAFRTLRCVTFEGQGVPRAGQLVKVTVIRGRLVAQPEN